MKSVFHHIHHSVPCYSQIAALLQLQMMAQKRIVRYAHSSHLTSARSVVGKNEETRAKKTTLLCVYVLF